jgi:hypothetical protein
MAILPALAGDHSNPSELSGSLRQDAVDAVHHRHSLFQLLTSIVPPMPSATPGTSRPITVGPASTTGAAENIQLSDCTLAYVYGQGKSLLFSHYLLVRMSTVRFAPSALRHSPNRIIHAIWLYLCIERAFDLYLRVPHLRCYFPLNDTEDMRDHYLQIVVRFRKAARVITRFVRNHWPPAHKLGVTEWRQQHRNRMQNQVVRGWMRDPITLQIMADPVADAEGHLYDRATLEQILKVGGRSPYTTHQLPNTIRSLGLMKIYIGDILSKATRRPGVAASATVSEPTQRHGPRIPVQDNTEGDKSMRSFLIALRQHQIRIEMTLTGLDEDTGDGSWNAIDRDPDIDSVAEMIRNLFTSMIQKQSVG